MAVLVNNFASNLNDLTEQNFNDAFEAYIQVIHKVIDTHASLTQMSRKEKKLQSKPWITKVFMNPFVRKTLCTKLIIYRTMMLRNESIKYLPIS